MTNSVRDQKVVEDINQLISDVGGAHSSFDFKLIRELIQTALRLVTDGADTGEIKLASRSLRELRYALRVFRNYNDRRKISIYGSARTHPDHPHYQTALRFSRAIAEAGWMTITGAGDGIMGAGNEGAGRENTFGVGIKLPFETNANQFIKGDPKFIMFRYFFTRKLLFMSQSHAAALFAGGFGTQDEGFEALTLVQTGKAPIMPIVMIDSPEDDYWINWDHFIRRNLLNKGMISEEDASLYLVTKDTDLAVKHITDFYANFHSLRRVGDNLVLRIHHPLNPEQLDAINTDFQMLVAKGKIKQSGPLESETNHLDLTRIYFHHTGHAYGKLRQLIDRINRYTPVE